MFKKMKVGDVAAVYTNSNLRLLRDIEGLSWLGNIPSEIPIVKTLYVKKTSESEYEYDWVIHPNEPKWKANYYIPLLSIPDGYEPVFEDETIGHGWKYYMGHWKDFSVSIGDKVSSVSGVLVIKPKPKEPTVIDRPSGDGWVYAEAAQPPQIQDGEYAHFETREEWEAFSQAHDLSAMNLQDRTLKLISDHYATKEKFAPFYLAAPHNGISGYALSSTLNNLSFITRNGNAKEYTGHKKQIPQLENQIIRNESGTAIGVAESYINPGQAVCLYGGKAFPFKSLSFAEQPVNQDVYDAADKVSEMISSRPNWITRSHPADAVAKWVDELTAFNSESARRQEILEVVKLAMENM